ncbi:p21-activated protein kinase-interacting protein 1 isoform X4 [Sapajus apella]|uniref:P21-activated protein kinase-interacting protein 1 isoform X4 n=1 Tax=Sapajus apella TaxID=9515 RepID=A0A6J3FJQ4_SAPAP|nr:p21-activated protein kinase-interacting protein 1 isoform X4 [Sapajus apella]
MQKGPRLFFFFFDVRFRHLQVEPGWRKRHVLCSMELVAGCYEQVLFGFTVHPKPEVCGDHEQWTPVADFTHHAHTASLSAVAVNSRFVVTGSKDETIHIYDMKKKIEHGALVHHSDAHIVEWSPRGEQYVVIIQNKIDIYQLDTASISGTITNEKRISAVKFLSESVLAVAGDEEVIRFFDCDSLVCLCEFKAHENRVKAMFSFEIPEHHVIVTASSDGFIKMWKLKQNKKVRPSLLCEVNTNARLTCLGVWLDTVPDTKASLPPAAELSPVSKEQSKIGKKEPGDTVHKEEKQSKPNTKKCGLTGDSKKATQESSLVSTKKRKTVEVLEKKRKKKKMKTMQ